MKFALFYEIPVARPWTRDSEFDAYHDTLEQAVFGERGKFSIFDQGDAVGLVREIVAAYFFGVSGKINAFTVASQVPSLVRAFVGDAALSGAFVPVFSELLAKEEKARAWRVASTIFWLVLIGVSVLTAVLILIAPLLILPFGDPGGDPEATVILLAAPKAVDYYPRIGMTRHDSAWILRPGEEPV